MGLKVEPEAHKWALENLEAGMEFSLGFYWAQKICGP